MSNVWSEGFVYLSNFRKFEYNFAYNQKMSGYANSAGTDQVYSIKLSILEVTKALGDLDPKKSLRTRRHSWSVTKMIAQKISPSLCRLFNLSLSLGTVPALWKRANITPTFRSNDPFLTLTMNYRPISALCIISKTLERCVFSHCYPLLAPKLYTIFSTVFKKAGPLLPSSSRFITIFLHVSLAERRLILFIWTCLKLLIECPIICSSFSSSVTASLVRTVV